MTRNGKVLAGLGVVVVVVGATAVGWTQLGGASSSKSKQLVILDDVQRRTLSDTVTLTGTLARQEQRKVTSVTQGRVSAVYAKDGSVAQADDRLFAIDGRDAIAEQGTTEFFRPLAVGDRGDDVLQLKRILAAAGANPGPLTPVFTEQTQFALAQWQAANHYPGATPVAATTAMVTLTQSTSYKIGAQSSAGIVIGPGGGARTTGIRTPAAPRVVLTAFRPPTTAHASAVPTITIQSAAASVAEGAPATFVLTASSTGASAIDVDLTTGGTATSADIVVPPSVVTLPAGARSMQVVVATRADTLVEPDKTLTLSVAVGAGYGVGSPNVASTKIVDANVPEVHINGGGSVSPGASRVLTVVADQAPVRDTQVTLSVAGDATPTVDYRSVNPVIVLRAGHTTASVPIDTLTTDTIEPDKHIVAALTPGAGYRVGSPGTAVVTITGARGDSALPIVTLTSATTHLTKGEPYSITVSLSRATSTPLTVTLNYGGNAVLGADYTRPAGTIVVPPNTTSLPVVVPTVADNVVESDRQLVVSIASSASYRVGSPSTVAVTIESAVMPEVTITSGSTTLAIGGAATFTIHADQAPVKDTSVNYQVVGTAQPGQDFEPLLGTALLRAGETSTTVTLRSLRKDVVFQPTDMIVGQWPIRIGQVFVKEGDPLPPGTPVLSLTDRAFTVTLQASASDRTKLSVGQRCTVKLTGGDKEVDGTISQLDDNLTTLVGATPGAASQQVYEGKINVSDLGAADGAAVSIDVTVQQRANVLTVPIAAVKQDGSGRDVVRVLDLDDRGRTTEVPVTTGLTEGSYIEIRKGLRGDETVIVEVDQPQ